MSSPISDQVDPNAVPEDLKARLKESYDAIAEHYNNNFTRDHDPIRLEYIGRLLEQLKLRGGQDATVLELGCGAGYPGTKILLDNESPRLHVTGNDISTTQLDLARKHLAGYPDRLVLNEGDMMDLSFPLASLDAVLGFYSIIHLPREEQTVLIGRIATWLKPGGIFLANFSYEEIEAAIVQTWLEQEKGWMYWSGWGNEKSVKMVEDADLEVFVNEIKEDVVDATFLWIMARKPETKS